MYKRVCKVLNNLCVTVQAVVTQIFKPLRGIPCTLDIHNGCTNCWTLKYWIFSTTVFNIHQTDFKFFKFWEEMEQWPLNNIFVCVFTNSVYLKFYKLKKAVCCSLFTFTKIIVIFRAIWAIKITYKTTFPNLKNVCKKRL